MDCETIKLKLKQKSIDRKELADKIDVSYIYLTMMLNGHAPLKEEYEKAIKKELEKR